MRVRLEERRMDPHNNPEDVAAAWALRRSNGRCEVCGERVRSRVAIRSGQMWMALGLGHWATGRCS